MQIWQVHAFLSAHTNSLPCCTQATEQDLQSLFGPIGDIVELYILRNNNGKSRGCAFVTYSNKGLAQQAITQLNGKQVIVFSLSSLVSAELDAHPIAHQGMRSAIQKRGSVCMMQEVHVYQSLSWSSAELFCRPSWCRRRIFRFELLLHGMQSAQAAVSTFHVQLASQTTESSFAKGDVEA